MSSPFNQLGLIRDRFSGTRPKFIILHTRTAKRLRMTETITEETRKTPEFGEPSKDVARQTGPALKEIQTTTTLQGGISQQRGKENDHLSFQMEIAVSKRLK